MIISASRRTDIPAFYGEWFINRLRAGEVLVRNPLNRKQVSAIPLSRDNVDAIVFWTKNPEPFLQHLPELDAMGSPYYFTITINPYDKTFEGNVPRKREIIASVRSLAERIGPERIIWRYDPIFFTDKLDRDYHLKWFDYLAGELEGTTEKCVFSFLRDYDKISRMIREKGVRSRETGAGREIVGALADLSAEHNMVLASCALKEDYSEFGVVPNSCIDGDLIERICGYSIDVKKDKSQRSECRCVESRDIGTYNTCLHGCSYCYANREELTTVRKASSYDIHSPILCDSLKGDEVVTPCRSCQTLKRAGRQGELF